MIEDRKQQARVRRQNEMMNRRLDRNGNLVTQHEYQNKLLPGETLREANQDTQKMFDRIKEMASRRGER